MEYLKRSNESDFDYIIRLVEGKSTGVYDIDYTELFKLAFDVEISSTEARKRYYGIKMMLPYLDKQKCNNITSNEIFSELELKKIELQKEKIKFQDQRREYLKLLRIDARFENLIEEIQKSVKIIEKQKPMIYSPVVKITNNKEGVLAISDWHSELEVNNFLNKFNKEEFLHRIHRLVNKTIEYGKFHNINTLHVFNLGDLLSGIIHQNVRVSNNELTVTQTMFIAELLADILFAFAQEFNHVKFYSVLDNHSRVFSNKEESIAGESFARFIPWYLKPRLSTVKNIEIVDNKLDEDIIVAEVCGKTIFAVHGHCDSLKNVVSDLSMMIKKIPEYVFTAHWHHNIEDEIHGCEVIANQSLIGVDEHSKRIRKTSKPAQKFMIFNHEEGRECCYNIRLDIY
jgi:hypothetical protein